MVPTGLRHSLRAIAAAALCFLAAACASRPADAPCAPVAGLDPGCVIQNRALLEEAVASYRKHYAKMDVGPSIAVTYNQAQIPFTTHWLRTDQFIVIDFSRPAYEKRLFLVNWKTGAAEAFHVSHGRGSAASERSYAAKRFTNVIGSGTSSVGAFVGGQEYLQPALGPGAQGARARPDRQPGRWSAPSSSTPTRRSSTSTATSSAGPAAAS